MSRSYRKPWVIDGMNGSSCKRYMKRQHNKRIRRYKSWIPSGGTHRKVGVNQWDISDYRWRLGPPPWLHYGRPDLHPIEQQWKEYRKLKRK